MEMTEAEYKRAMSAALSGAAQRRHLRERGATEPLRINWKAVGVIGLVLGANLCVVALIRLAVRVARAQGWL
jgi:hypothetical protein